MNNFKEKRFKHTIDFFQEVARENVNVLDLGTPNELSNRIRKLGCKVENTSGEDLDLKPEIVKKFDVEIVTAFEILEHLVSPLNVLMQLPCNKLVASIPLRLWFAKAYKSSTDPWDRHYHEFEDWQFDWLLDKAGWNVVSYKKWTSPINQIGFRPILRRFVPRYYIVYAERK